MEFAIPLNNVAVQFQTGLGLFLIPGIALWSLLAFLRTKNVLIGWFFGFFAMKTLMILGQAMLFFQIFNIGWLLMSIGMIVALVPLAGLFSYLLNRRLAPFFFIFAAAIVILAIILEFYNPSKTSLSPDGSLSIISPILLVLTFGHLLIMMPLGIYFIYEGLKLKSFARTRAIFFGLSFTMTPIGGAIVTVLPILAYSIFNLGHILQFLGLSWKLITLRQPLPAPTPQAVYTRRI